MKAVITGANGMLGSAIKKELGDGHFYHTRNVANLTSPEEVEKMFYFIKNSSEKYDTLIQTSAKVAGLGANIANPMAFFEDNVAINNNVLLNAYRYGFENVVTILSTCLFPAEATYPLSIDQIDAGKPHYSNRGYAYAKRLLAYETNMYRQASEKNWISIIPSNLFGPHDNFNLNDSHIIPGLIHKAYLASKTGEDLIIWGDGSPLRQFVFSEDLSKIILWAIDNWKSGVPLLAIEEKEYSIKHIAETIAKKFNIPSSKIKYDTSKSNGQHRKPAKSDLKDFKFTPFEEALDKTIDWFVKNYDIARK